MRQATAEMKTLLQRCGSSDYSVAMAAQREMAQALVLPLRQGVLKGDIIGTIFEPIEFAPGTAVEFPYDFISPGTEKEYTAWVMPNHGYVPQRAVEGDQVTVQTYRVANAIDWNLRYARDARWDIVSHAIEVFMNGFIRKFNTDAWRTILAAGLNRNILVSDAAATAGRLTVALISAMKTSMWRNGGGNTGSVNGGMLTDLYVSVEAMEDMRGWVAADVDDFTRREIFTAEDGVLTKVFSINMHQLFELGVAQEYQLYWTEILAGTMGASDQEIVVGLDLQRRDSFVMPIREPVQMFEDPVLHREQRQGYYGWAEVGISVLDNRRVLVGSL